MAVYPKFSDEILRALCAVIGDTESGLSGSQIGKVLSSAKIKDLAPGITKKDRLFEALRYKQETDGCSNNILDFIMRVLSPINFVKNPEDFETFRSEINRVLLFDGYEIDENGKIQKVKNVTNLTESQKRANRLEYELKNRKVHPEVLKYCKPELLQKNYFHAVLEAVKGIASRIRSMTNLQNDGADLVNDSFKVANPYIIINNLQNDTEKSEQKGFINLLTGVFGMFRNVTAHAAKIEWNIEEEEAFDLLTLVSLIHKKLDKSTIIKTKP